MLFSYIRHKKTVRNNIGPLVDNDNKLISDDKDMASLLNSTFSRVFTDEDKADIPIYSNIIFQGPDEEKLIITEIQAHEVRKFLHKIDPNKFVSPTENSPRLLKEFCAQFETPIKRLSNKSLTQARVPRALKSANITLISKKREKKQANNYQPIRLTPVLIKLFKRSSGIR